MKIFVLFKKVPDTEAKITLTTDKKSIDFSSTKFIVNPYDEIALEEAIRLKESVLSGKTTSPTTSNNGQPVEVVACCFSDAQIQELFLKVLAIGADRGIHILNTGFEAADSLTTAKIISQVIKAEAPDIVFCGRHAIDDDNMHVPTMIADLLGWPHVSPVSKFSLNDTIATVERPAESGQVEKYEVHLPAVFGTDRALNQPRYATLPNIMKAKKKPLDKKQVSDFELNQQELLNGSKTKIIGYELPPQKQKGKIFKDEDVSSMVDKVINLLKTESHVI